jgi:hypothetical protein
MGIAKLADDLWPASPSMNVLDAAALTGAGCH